MVPLNPRSTPGFDFRRVFPPRDKKRGFGHWGVEEVQVRASVSQQLRFHNTAASSRRAVVQIVPEPSTRSPAHLTMCPERRESNGCRTASEHCSAMLARTAALRHGGEACLDFKDSASPLLEACGTVQADHTEHPRQLAWPHS